MEKNVLQTRNTFLYWIFCACCIRIVCSINNTSTWLEITTPSIGEERNNTHVVMVKSFSSSTSYQKLERCNEVTKKYKKQWNRHLGSLASYLSFLKLNSCPQFEEECKQPTYAFNNFTILIYDYFCFPDLLIEKCFPILFSMVNDRQKNQSYQNRHLEHFPFEDERSDLAGIATISRSESIEAEWINITSRIRNIQITSLELTEPCLQVALYNESIAYREFKSVELPTCDLVWCGFDELTIAKYQISIWTCLLSKCRTNIRIFGTLFVILGLTVTILNLIVILVLSLYPSMRKHSPSIYKLSLAFADLLMGAIGFPTFIISLWMSVYDPEFLYRTDASRSGWNNSDGNITSTNNVPFLQLLEYPSPYMNFAGFINAISLSVSMYTLAAFGFDRLIAVYKPLRYKEKISKVLAKRTCGTIWIIACAFSLLPFLVPTLNYYPGYGFFNTIQGLDAIIIYVVTGAIPLLVMWTLSIATYCVMRKHNRVSQRASSVQSRLKVRQTEYQLSKILVLMVGAFTFCLLPALVVLAGNSLIPSITSWKIKNYDLQKDLRYSFASVVVIIILLCNSLCNFFIYSARHDEFRKTVTVMFRTALSRVCVKKESSAPISDELCVSCC